MASRIKTPHGVYRAPPLPMHAVGLICSGAAGSVAELLPKHKAIHGKVSRARLTGGLLHATGYLGRCPRIGWDLASNKELEECHSRDYIEMLGRCDSNPGLKLLVSIKQCEHQKRFSGTGADSVTALSDHTAERTPTSESELAYLRHKSPSARRTLPRRLPG